MFINSAPHLRYKNVRCGVMEYGRQVYFNESAQTAKEVAGECIGLWTKLLEQSDNDTRAALTRSMGLKIEQLKAELKLLDHAHDD